VCAVILIGVRTWRLVFNPDALHDAHFDDPLDESGKAPLNTDIIAVIGFLVLFLLMLLRVPVGMAMGLVGITGYSWIVGAGPALKLVGQTSMRTVTDYTFASSPCSC